MPPAPRLVLRSLPVLVLGLALGLGACGEDAVDRALSPEGEQGQELVRSLGCGSCHSSTGRSGLGPTFLDMWGTQVELTDGTTVTYDEEYVETAIRDPGAQVRDGYRDNMPRSWEDMSPEDVDAIIAYLRDLGPQDAGTTSGDGGGGAG